VLKVRNIVSFVVNIFRSHTMELSEDEDGVFEVEKILDTTLDEVIYSLNANN